MLSNSVVAAVLGASYVVVLVLQLNPTLSTGPPSLLPLALTVGLFYAAHLTVIFYIWLVIRQVFARELFSPAWTSVSVLSWLGTAAAAWLRSSCGRTCARRVVAGRAWTSSSGMLALIAAASSSSSASCAPIPAAAPGRCRCARRLRLDSCSVACAGRARDSLETRSAGALLEQVSRTPVNVTVLAIDAGSLDPSRARPPMNLPTGRVLVRGPSCTRHDSPDIGEAVWTAVATGKLQRTVCGRRVPPIRARGEPLQLLPDYCFAHALGAIRAVAVRTSAAERAVLELERARFQLAS
jgi:hypothetical protein